ncbi:prepilin-type N-terminal cleavage/methylation domain-containing protein [Roseateles saccharophilus]|uniref:Pilin/secretion family protein with methylation motif n=1 Tax=Roseateles saccharophilus TaxID=304 RepID=A0A4R3UR14_ROSSA|nr:prepilin-type N-terminal cleavage/methylation domain-containing protein [Roseateles saccharophilus]MDG0833654.1 hypothetical protein [Roseateles saccharophilus]TCU93241.1 pilin/secretion family protein with methylation motif [Roseateles saccharophilus]
MKSKHITPRGTPGPRRGVTLIEALVALLVMSFGMVALVGLMANLRRSGDVARQRGDAMRIAQGELANLRSFAVLTSTTTPDYDNSIASLAPYDVTGQDLNTTYTLTRAVTPLIQGSGEPRARTMSVTVSWQDRADQQSSIKLDSIVSRTDPAFSGATGIAPPTNGIRTPSGRHPAVPVDAKDLGNKSSAFRPGGGGTAVWVFNNLTGAITSICTIPVDTPVSSLTASDVAGCTSTTAFLVSGTIRFSATSPANPTTPEALALPSVSAMVSLIPSQFSDPSDKTKLAPNAGYAGTPQCFSDAPSSPDATRSFVNYNCIVYPNTQTTPNWWGHVLLTGLNVGTDATQFRVCRYSADYNGNGYTFTPNATAGYAYLAGTTPSYFLIDNEEHPDIYRGVTYSLTRQNFLVVRGDVACPAAPAPSPSAGIFVDYSTLQLQP